MSTLDLVFHPYTTSLVRWMLAGVLIVAGLSKVSNPITLLATIEAFGVLPPALRRPVAACLPWLEIAVAAALALGIGTRLAAVTTLILMITFSTAIAVNLLRGNAVECNCFGPLYRGRISHWSLLRNSLLALAAIWVLKTYDGYLSLEAWLFAWPRNNAPTPVGLLPVVLVAALLGVGLLLLQQTISSLRKVHVTNER